MKKRRVSASLPKRILDPRSSVRSERLADRWEKGTM